MPLLAHISNAVRDGLRFLLHRPVMWLSDRFTSFPDQESINKSLDELYQQIVDGNTKKGRLVNIDPQIQSIIIFSDQHKGTRNGSDDFELSEKNYLKALDYYNKEQYSFISLGDSEELWENSVLAVMKHYKKTFEAEAQFANRYAFYKVYGNHDLFWDYDPFASTYLKKMYNTNISIYGGIVLRIELNNRKIDIFCTHGHQGDKQSDGNAFSKWFVSYFWGPLQAYLEINTNRPSANNELKTLHNQLMYHWAKKKDNIILVTGHTHQPVFASLTHLERLLLKREEAIANNDHETIRKINAEIPRRRREYDHVKNSLSDVDPSYFNTGCCCYKDGNITGIEISENFIRLVKWSQGKRIIAEEKLI
jgi:predicted phosphodiesterase